MASQGAREDEVAPGWTIIVLLGLTLAVLAIAPFIGRESIPFAALWDGTSNDTQATILWKLRIPRALMAFLAGAGLATSGMVFQAMFRNPLATPFTLGVSSGASLGASIAIQCGWTFALWGLSATTIAAFFGAVVSIALVYLMTARSRSASTATMLLAGVAVSFFFSSMILFLQYMSDFTRSFRMLRWVMGGLEKTVNFQDVLHIVPFVVSGCLIVWYLTFELNLLTTGEEFAFSRGVNVSQTKMLLFFAVSMMVGAIVAICGPIGFVGLMAPHICRLLIGYDHRWLYPATLLFGGMLLIVCDTLSRTVIVGELPVGIITALLGGPFFLWLLMTRQADVESA